MVKLLHVSVFSSTFREVFDKENTTMSCYITHVQYRVQIQILEELKILKFQYGTYTGYKQKNGAFSKVNKKFISNLTRAQRTPSAAATVQVSHTQKAFFCCDAILETGPAVSVRSELLVAHEKLGQLPLLTVYVVSV